MNGRSICNACQRKVLLVHVAGRLTVLDWPRAENGDYAAEQTVAGAWRARYRPVGETILPTERRYRRHECQPPEPGDQLAAWRKARAGLNAGLRNKRGTRPAQPITGVRKAT